MENIITRSSSDVVKEQFEVYGEYTNLNRHIPFLYDGLKPSYKRLMISGIELAKDKLVKSATLVGHTIGHYHPHGDQSIGPIIAELVHNKIFIGQGNFGKIMLYSEDAEPAAVRYTEAGISPKFMNLFSPVLKYVPKIINDLGYDEYVYLPTPIPIAMMIGYLGIGVGTGCRIPAFTPESLLDAYLADDPRLLINSENLKIENLDELKNVWNTGRGIIKYSINTRIEGDSVIIEGNKGPIRPNYKWFDDQKKAGNIAINDYSSGDICKLVITKSPRIRVVSVNSIYEHAVSIMKGQESYYVRCVYDRKVRNIGLRDWIEITYNNYILLYKKYISDEISAAKYQITLYTHFREIANLILSKNDSYEDIAKKLNVDLSIVKDISGKTLHTLRTSDPKRKIAGLQDRILELNRTDPEEVISNNIRSL